MTSYIFSIEDCNKVIDIYSRYQKKKISYGLVRAKSNEAMLDDFKRAYAIFIIRKIQSKAPTPAQLRKLQNPIRSKALNLRESLVNLESHHFLSSLLFAKLKKPLYDVADDVFEPVWQEMQSNVNGLISHLNWLIETLEPFRDETFIYPHLKDSKEKPETFLVNYFSDIITIHFKGGGYSRGDNTASGWRIEMIQYLLNKADISMTNSQIVDAITKN